MKSWNKKSLKNKILSFKFLGFFFLRTFCAKNYRTLFLKKTSENFLVNGGESFCGLFKYFLVFFFNFLEAPQKSISKLHAGQLCSCYIVQYLTNDINQNDCSKPQLENH